LWFGRRPFAINCRTPLITFSFDDFPESAWSTAGAILVEFDLRATYFTSLGLAGQVTPTGRIFDLDNIFKLLAKRHELGCHTYDHCPAWETSTASYVASVRHNAADLYSLTSGVQFKTHSFPISYPRPSTKRIMSTLFHGCRGGGQTFNRGVVDLNYLHAFFIEQSRDNPKFIEQTIEANTRASGWLIFATHDVAEQPTRYGCTPAVFRRVVLAAVKSGATILPMSEALSRAGSVRNSPNL
jgi:peptidoglycan/xylan/chitin deacetylase (PgdA/CDA1 family)